jgi:prepilin-type processing-associated H-X9-DG protein
MHDMRPLGDVSGGGFVHDPRSMGTTQTPNTQGPNMDMLYLCPNPADAQLARMPCATWQPSGPLEYLSAAPRSHHPGGVNVVFADGRVGFATDSVDEVAFAYMVSVGDGQPVDVARHIR